MKELKCLLGQRIKDIRIKRGFSQQKLAELIDIDQRNLSNIECGNTFPAKSLMQIANVLNVTLPELFDFDYIPKTNDEMKKYIVDNLPFVKNENIKILYKLISIMK